MPPQKTRADNEDLKHLALALAEARRRGIQLPQSVTSSFKKQELIWPLGSNGYFIRNDGKMYKPSEMQANFIHSEAPFSQFYGRRGVGKTGAGAQKALYKIMAGESGAVMNPDFENFKLSTWPEFKNWIPWDIVVPSQRHRKNNYWQPTQPFTMAFLNGAVVYCKGLKDADSARGPNLNWLWYDEGGRDPTGDGWKIGCASVRVGNNPQRWVTMTPKGLTHWSYKFFIEQEMADDVKEMLAELGLGDKILIESFHGTMKDNLENLDPLFLANISTNYPSGFLRSQEYEGEYANEGGKIGDSAWFRGRIIDEDVPKIQKRYRYWDLAATEKKQAKDDPDESVGTLGSSFLPKDNPEFLERYKEQIINPKIPNFVLENQVFGFWGWEDLLKAICNTARHDGPFVEILIEQEPGSGGKNQIAAIKSELHKIPELSTHKVTEVNARSVGDRVLAANTYWFGVASEGRMWMRKGLWNALTLGQIDGFTQILHDDRVTSITGVMYKLNPYKAWRKSTFLTT